MPNLGPMEIVVIFVVALLVLGPTRLPEAGRQVGRAFSEFRRWSSGFQRELQDAVEGRDDPQPAPVTPIVTASDTADEGSDSTGRESVAMPTPEDLEPSLPDSSPDGNEPSGA